MAKPAEPSRRPWWFPPSLWRRAYRQGWDDSVVWQRDGISPGQRRRLQRSRAATPLLVPDPPA